MIERTLYYDVNNYFNYWIQFDVLVSFENDEQINCDGNFEMRNFNVTSSLRDHSMGRKFSFFRILSEILETVCSQKPIGTALSISSYVWFAHQQNHRKHSEGVFAGLFFTASLIFIVDMFFI